jgi:cell division protein ZipA
MKCYRSAVVAIAAIAIGCGETDVANEHEIQKDEQGRIVMGDLVLAPESESRGRTELLPTTPTEDARHVLGQIDLPKAASFDAERDYLPEPAVSWIVDVRFADDPRLDPNAISDAFDKGWRKAFGGFMDFGRDVDTRHWTYLISADGPKAVDRLKFAFDYIDVLDDDATLADASLYRRRLEEIGARLKAFGTPIVSASVQPGDAVQRSKLLRDIKRTQDMSMFLVLKAPPGKRFDGKRVWDVMLCLGLQWGDMDCFHWRNESEIGDSYFFSVYTSTPPGYFLPEEVAAGRVHVDDLVFGYSVPRSGKPVEVFDSMHRAAEYCRKRLGGTVVDGDGNTVDPTMIREQIVEVVDKLRSAGFEPGVNATLQLF